MPSPGRAPYRVLRGSLPFTGYLPIIRKGIRRGGDHGMVMVVHCKCCMTEYRLDEALLKGAKGACIRCPKCRERFIVGNPQRPTVATPRMPRVAPPAASPNSPPKVPLAASPAVLEAVSTPIRATEPEGRTSPVPLDRRAEGADLSGRIRSDPMAGVDDRIVFSPTPN